jgi:hypothetical protein
MTPANDTPDYANLGVLLYFPTERPISVGKPE